MSSVFIYNPRGFDGIYDYDISDHINLFNNLIIYAENSSIEFSDGMNTIMQKMTADHLEDETFFKTIGASWALPDEPTFTAKEFEDKDFVEARMAEYKANLENNDCEKVRAWALSADNATPLPEKFFSPIWEYGLDNGYLFHLRTSETGNLDLKELKEKMQDRPKPAPNLDNLNMAIKRLHDAVNDSAYNCDCQKGGVDAMSIDTDWLRYISDTIRAETQALIDFVNKNSNE